MSSAMPDRGRLIAEDRRAPLVVSDPLLRDHGEAGFRARFVFDDAVAVAVLEANARQQRAGARLVVRIARHVR